MMLFTLSASVSVFSLPARRRPGVGRERKIEAMNIGEEIALLERTTVTELRRRCAEVFG